MGINSEKRLDDGIRNSVSFIGLFFFFFYPVERGEIQFHFNSDSETSNFYGFTRFNFAKLLRRESEKKLEDLLEKLQSVGIFETNFYSPLPIP